MLPSKHQFLCCVFFPFLPALTLYSQNFLRCQNNKTNYNLVCETLQFLDCICGSTTGGLGLLGLYINEKNVALINQTLESLTEYCQGPCHENQVTHPGLPKTSPFLLHLQHVLHGLGSSLLDLCCLIMLLTLPALRRGFGLSGLLFFFSL